MPADDIDDPDRKQWVRNNNAHDARLRALQDLRKRDFEEMMGSGINILLTDLRGQPITPEFQIAAEAMDEIKQPMIESLVDSLRQTVVRHRIQLRQIEDELGPEHTPKETTG